MAVLFSAKGKLTILAQTAQRAHRTIVRATNRPNRGVKTPGAYLLLRSHQSFVHSSSYPETQWFPVGPHDRSNSPGGAIERYYYFGAVAGTSGRRFEECNHWLGCFLLETRMRAVGKQKASVRRVGILVLHERRQAGSEFQKIEKISEIPGSLTNSMFIVKKNVSGEY